MSFSPSLGMVRLQELKLWQGSYDNLMQRSRRSSSNVSQQDSPNSSFQSLENGAIDQREWDKRKITPTKPFEQLLEEKLVEDMPMVVEPKVKRPFLRKGEGTARFRMSTIRPAMPRIKSVGSKKQALPKSTPLNHPKLIPRERKSILKNSNPLYHQEVDLSPLTVPDFVVKPRGTWKQVFDSTTHKKSESCLNEAENTLENYEEFRKSLGSGENNERDHPFKASSNTADAEGCPQEVKKHTSGSNFDKHIFEAINDYAKKYFSGQSPLLSNSIPETVAELHGQELDPKPPGDLTLEELNIKKELKIFETLEKKVDSSSFCSTNTSIVNLLMSTPQKQRNSGLLLKSLYSEQNRSFPDSLAEQSAESVFPNAMKNDIQVKLREVSAKTDVLQQFLMNLQNMERCREEDEENGSVDSACKKIEKSTSTGTSFSEETTRWSSRSPSLVDNYTEYDSTYQSDDKWASKKVDAGVNTSFDSCDKLDETVQSNQPCKECDQLRSKYSDTKSILSDLKSDNAKLKTEIRNLQKEFDKAKKNAKKDEEQYQTKLEKLECELDSERQKLTKERAFFESYVKDAQNRPSKKEREEITRLKQELADVKETLKLKEAKSGATQARLRTQVKQQEKELAEMKITVEKLQRENAKLTASQKYLRRPQEVKMLHEINKNITKLTEETFKKQLNKSARDEEKLIKKGETILNESGDKENEKSSAKNVQSSLHRSNIDDIKFNDTPTDGVSIEHQYETIFGHFASPRNVSVSTELEKTEKTLADGSVEIMYSNGNLKTISADGKFIRLKYFNGDTKETDLNQQIVRYHYAAADSWHIQHPDGTEIMEFKDGQKCTKRTDGKTEVSYPDGSTRIINGDGTQEQTFPDGRKTLKNLQGETIILLPNGQREIHTDEYKRREYPDGTIRTLHKDGTVETVYANGRVRLKDANGVLIMDTHQT